MLLLLLWRSLILWSSSLSSSGAKSMMPSDYCWVDFDDDDADGDDAAGDEDGLRSVGCCRDVRCCWSGW